MKTSIISRITIVVLLVLCTTCGDMDETYKEFIGDAPIIYLERVYSGWILPGRDRIQFDLDPTSDPRIEYVLITWSNGLYSKKFPVTYGKITECMIDENVREGMYDFVISHRTEDGLFSLSTTVAASTLGEIYESLLLNRNVLKIEFDMHESEMTLFFPSLSDSTNLGIEIRWDNDGRNEPLYFENTEDNTILVTGFPVNIRDAKFEYRSRFKPQENALDIFYSQWKTCRFDIVDEVIAYPFDIDASDITPSRNAIVLQNNGNVRQMFDNDLTTYFALRKAGQTTDTHNEILSFIIDLKEPKLFDYIEWGHPTDAGSPVATRVWSFNIYGSNDGVNFSQIGDEITIPGEDDRDIITSILEFEESTYRYVKIEYGRYAPAGGTTVRIGEFRLGYSKYTTGYGIGILK